MHHAIDAGIELHQIFIDTLKSLNACLGIAIFLIFLILTIAMEKRVGRTCPRDYEPSGEFVKFHWLRGHLQAIHVLTSSTKSHVVSCEMRCKNWREIKALCKSIKTKVFPVSCWTTNILILVRMFQKNIQKRSVMFLERCKEPFQFRHHRRSRSLCDEIHIPQTSTPVSGGQRCIWKAKLFLFL